MHKFLIEGVPSVAVQSHYMYSIFFDEPGPYVETKNQRALASQSSQASPSLFPIYVLLCRKKYLSVCECVCVCMCVFTNQYYMIVGAYIVASKDSQSTRQQQSVNRGGGGGV